MANMRQITLVQVFLLRVATLGVFSVIFVSSVGSPSLALEVDLPENRKASDEELSIVFRVAPCPPASTGLAPSSLPDPRDVVSSRHDVLIDSWMFVDRLLRKEEQLLKLSMLRGKTHREACQLLLDRLAVEQSPKDPTVFVARLATDNSEDAEVILRTLADSLLEFLEGKWRDEVARRVDRLRHTEAKVSEWSQRLRDEAEELSRATDGSSFRSETVSLLIEQVEETQNALNKKRRIHALVEECLQKNEAEAIRETRWMLIEWGELDAQNPANEDSTVKTIVKYAGKKIANEITWLEEQQLQLKERLQKYSDEASREDKIGRLLGELELRMEAARNMERNIRRKLLEFDAMEEANGFRFELLTPPARNQ